MRVRLAFVGAPYRVDGCGYRNRPHEIHLDSAMVSEPVNGLDVGGVGLSGHDSSAAILAAGVGAEGETGIWRCLIAYRSARVMKSAI